MHINACSIKVCLCVVLLSNFKGVRKLDFESAHVGLRFGGNDITRARSMKCRTRPKGMGIQTAHPWSAFMIMISSWSSLEKIGSENCCRCCSPSCQCSISTFWPLAVARAADQQNGPSSETSTNMRGHEDVLLYVFILWLLWKCFIHYINIVSSSQRRKK